MSWTHDTRQARRALFNTAQGTPVCIRAQTAGCVIGSDVSMATDRGDMRLIPGAYEIRAPRPADTARAALEIRHPAAATVAWALPAPRHQTMWIGRAGAALGSLGVALGLIMLLGLIPRAIAYLLAWIG